MTEATLLARTDAPLYCLHVGSGALERAAALSGGHCFEVVPLLSLPRAPGNIAEQIADIVTSGPGGAVLSNGWFECPSLKALVVALVTLCTATLAAAGQELSDVIPGQNPGSDTPAGSLPEPPHAEAQTQHNAEVASESAQEDEDMDDILWLYVEECSTTQADKAATIRVALEELAGKPNAKRILSRTRATVAKDANGHKNRILCVGKKPIRLIPERNAVSAMD